MKRGEIWTVSGGDYSGKPRPAVILQSDAFRAIGSVTICPLTTDMSGSDLVRISVLPDSKNCLKSPSKLMSDKITTVPKGKMGVAIGTLGEDDMRRLERVVLIFLGLA